VRPSRLTWSLGRRLRRSTALASLAVGTLGLAGAVAATMARGGVPAPRVHDEFSYLLAADTYARGRLTNPTPPMWEHFETFHVLMTPSYASKFPPAQGLALAVGQLLTGQPIVGVWLSFGLMCGSLVWMLWGWVRPGWALWGGAFACFWLLGRQAFGAAYEPAYWATTYWGGAVAATGGALLFGGLRRILARPAAAPALAIAAGLAILANSRPAEGLAVALVPGAIFCVWLVRNRSRGLRQLLGPVASLALGLAVTGAWMAWYNYRVTGNALAMPYLAYEVQYGTVRPFLWLPQGQPARVNRLPVTHRRTTSRAVPPSAGRLEKVVTKLSPVRRYYLPFYALALLVTAPWILKDRWARVALVSAGLVVATLAAETWNLAHYAAPGLAPLTILLVMGARRLGALRLGGRRLGSLPAAAVLALAVGWAVIGAVESVAARELHREAWPAQRQEMTRDLKSRGGRHLVLVSYGLNHTPGAEWVHNGADLENSPVIWARSLGPAADSALSARFGGRTVWRLNLDHDRGPFRLTLEGGPARD
jgi:hypothetical protein